MKKKANKWTLNEKICRLEIAGNGFEIFVEIIEIDVYEENIFFTTIP